MDLHELATASRLISKETSDNLTIPEIFQVYGEKNQGEEETYTLRGNGTIMCSDGEHMEIEELIYTPNTDPNEEWLDVEGVGFNLSEVTITKQEKGYLEIHLSNGDNVLFNY